MRRFWLVGSFCFSDSVYRVSPKNADKTTLSQRPLLDILGQPPQLLIHAAFLLMSRFKARYFVLIAFRSSMV